MWRPQVSRFSQAGWRVIAPDLRGYGQTTVMSGKTTLETFARDIVNLLDRLDVNDIVLGGLSMGGQIVMEFYRLFPDRVRGLVLADTSPHAESASGKKLRNDTADRLLSEGMKPFADEVLPKMITPHNIDELPSVAQHVLDMMRATSAVGAAAALRGRAERRDYVDMLGLISVPTLVVVGEKDEFTPLGDAQLMCERIPGATLAVVAGAGHMPNLERADAFNDELAQFLTKVQAIV
jgi:pimeloyl-ACP methyl ester carboxylesterase